MGHALIVFFLSCHLNLFLVLFKNMDLHLHHLTLLLVFVEGDFEEGDVVCTTWTWVYIGATCMVFLVCSILVVCVLCIYTNRRSVERHAKDHHYISSAQHSIVNGITDKGVSTSSQGTLYQSQLGYRNSHPLGYIQKLRDSLWRSLFANWPNTDPYHLYPNIFNG